jgi:dTDP-4-dehydrorhamnose reductase
MSRGPILVLGAGGQLGLALLEAAAGRTAVGVSRTQADITDRDSIRRVLDAHEPSVVLNAAAFTAVDRAETEVDTAFAVNRDGAANVALACGGAGVGLVHVSTDYVFDGRRDAPYSEADATSPTSVYGASKLAGEEAVRALGPPAQLIVRTAWVFSERGNNFVRTMWRLAQERETLRVVGDQRGSPTPAADLATALLAMADAVLADQSLSGLYHWAGSPPATWYDLACAVVEEGRRHGPLSVHEVEAIATADYPTPASRPPNAVLDTRRAQGVFGLQPPDWRVGVARVVDRLSRSSREIG